MTVEVVAPTEFQGAVIGNLNQRKGTIEDTEVREEEFTLTAEVSLNDMFGYSSGLRGITQGKGEFSMEYKCHQPVMPNIQKDMTDGKFFSPVLLERLRSSALRLLSSETKMMG